MHEEAERGKYRPCLLEVYEVKYSCQGSQILSPHMCYGRSSLGLAVGLSQRLFNRYIVSPLDRNLKTSNCYGSSIRRLPIRTRQPFTSYSYSCPVISSGSKYMFADHTSIYCSGKSVDEVTCMLYMALRELRYTGVKKIHLYLTQIFLKKQNFTGSRQSLNIDQTVKFNIIGVIINED